MLQPIRVLVTAVGCPGASTLLRMLKNNGERDVYLVGVDCDDTASGQFFVDKFYQVPEAKYTNHYIYTMISIIHKEKIDVLLPESSLEIPVLANRKNEIENATGCKVLVSSSKSVQIANNKALTYVLAKRAGAKLPKWRIPKTIQDFAEDCYVLGYPNVPICFKPHISKGSRGFRIIDNKVDRYDMLMNYKPNSRYITLDDACETFKERESFPDILVMEYVEGTEYTADCLCLNGKALLTQIKSNNRARWGVTVRGEIVNRPDIIDQVEKILSVIPLSYCVNLQFIDGKLIEINPRVSTFIYQDDLIPPYLAIKLALGEITPEQVATNQDKIDIGRKFIRYMDQVFY